MEKKKGLLIGLLVFLLFGWTGLTRAQNGDLIRNPVRDTIRDAAGSFIFVFDHAQVGAGEVPARAAALAKRYGAALDNAIDVVGVAAGATVRPIRVLNNKRSGTVDGVVAGIDYVAQFGAPGDVANLSLGASGHFASLHQAIVNAADQGILFAIAAGNDSADAAGYEPAHVDHPNVLTVSAVDSTDTFASFSNWGNPPVDVAAPEVGILSTQKGGGVTTLSGTSMAAPHVAGLLLLYGDPGGDGRNAINDPDGNPDPIAFHPPSP